MKKQKLRLRPQIKRFIILSISLLITIAAGYILFLTVYPKLSYGYDQKEVKEEIAKIEGVKHGESSVSIGKNQKVLIIPSINLKEKIYQGDESSLNLGIWHKFSDRSSPSLGGNFLLIGHRFNFGLTPEETKRKSPLYNVDQLQVGDEIVVEWDGKVYYYIISERKKVDPDQIEIERNSRDDRLTIYTCTLGGRYDGREVIIAKPR